MYEVKHSDIQSFVSIDMPEEAEEKEVAKKKMVLNKRVAECAIKYKILKKKGSDSDENFNLPLLLIVVTVIHFLGHIPQGQLSIPFC